MASILMRLERLRFSVKKIIKGWKNGGGQIACNKRSTS